MNPQPPVDDVHTLEDREDRPLEVEVHPDSVVITGPQGVSLALTPEAAVASAEILLDAAFEASVQSLSPGLADDQPAPDDRHADPAHPPAQGVQKPKPASS